jgi:hypothetical protein
MAYDHLVRVQTALKAIGGDESLDLTTSLPALSSASSDAHTAHELTSDLVWSAAERVPWLGPQLRAFGTIASSTDDLLTNSVLPLMSAAQSESLDSLKPSNGRLETQILETLSEPAANASKVASEASAAVESIDRTPLVGVVSSRVEEVSASFTGASSVIDALSRTTRLLPAMLGGEETRTYLLLVQNNAEWRSLGGITGTAILMQTDHGQVRLLGTESATSLSQGITEPVVDLPDELQDIYGTRPARYFHNLTQIPDFSVDGPLAHAMYARQTGVDVDGVIAIDPVVLSYMLRATGPIQMPDGETISAENAVPLLLNEVYARYTDPAAQDAFFAAATGAVFNAFLDGRGSVPGFLSAIARSSNEHRLLVWNKRADEQAILQGSTIAGALPTSDSRAVRFGVYLNDGTGSKMSYYVNPQVSLEWSSCQYTPTSSYRELTLRVNLTNTAPSDAATSLPTYVTGGGAYGTPLGSANVVQNIFLPEGFSLLRTGATNQEGFSTKQLDGRTVLTFGVELAPGATESVEVAVGGASSGTDAEASVTPTANSSLSPVVSASCTSTPLQAVIR